MIVLYLVVLWTCVWLYIMTHLPGQPFSLILVLRYHVCLGVSMKALSSISWTLFDSKITTMIMTTPCHEFHTKSKQGFCYCRFEFWSPKVYGVPGAWKLFEIWNVWDAILWAFRVCFRKCKWTGAETECKCEPVTRGGSTEPIDPPRFALDSCMADLFLLSGSPEAAGEQAWWEVEVENIPASLQYPQWTAQGA